MKQAQACFPQETGGFLGGHDNTILGVLPIPNKNLYDRTESFGISADDVDLAYRFLVKHKLEYLGVYHSHPRGTPAPSTQDLAHNQRFLFIIGLHDRYNPELYAWRVADGRVHSEDIKIISDAGITVLDINTGQPKLSGYASPQQLDRLAQMIDEMIAGRPPIYPRLGPSGWDASTFNTLA